MIELFILILAIVTYLARKPLGRAVRKNSRKAGRKLGKAARAGIAKLSWNAIKAGGREIRAHASWLGGCHGIPRQPG